MTGNRMRRVYVLLAAFVLTGADFSQGQNFADLERSVCYQGNLLIGRCSKLHLNNETTSLTG